MKSRRIHITGASGSGTTTLGRAVANALAVPHHDTDDYFWHPTEPPHRDKRDSAERLRLMREMFLPRAQWVLSGSLQGWGDPIISYFDLVVFLYTTKDLRLHASVSARPRALARTQLRRGDGTIGRPKILSNGPPNMTKATRSAERWKNIRPG